MDERTPSAETGKCPPNPDEGLEEGGWFRVLADSLPAVISYVDANLIYRFTNRACGVWYGTDPAAVLGTSMRDFLGEDRFRARKPQIDQALSGRHVHFYARSRHIALGPRNVVVDYIPHRSPAGQVCGFAIMVSDITELKNTERELRSFQQRLSVAFSASQMSGWEWDLRTHVLTHFGDVRAIFGIHSTKPSDYYRLADRATRALWLSTARSIIRNRTIQEIEFRIRRPDGEVRWVRSMGILQRRSDRTPLRLFGVNVDVTQRRLFEEDLQREKGFSENLIASSLDGICALDGELRVTVWNPAMEQMTGRRKEEAVGRRFEECFPYVGEDERGWLSRALEGQASAISQLAYTAAAGDRRFCDVHFSPILENPAKVTGVLVVVRDTTERKSHEEALAHNATHDQLTGLPNRQAFQEHVNRALAHATRRHQDQFAVLFLDLDRFKTVNDSLGHIAGDQILIGVAERLRRSLRPGDFAARLGGDEFTVLLDDVAQAADATAVAERILQSFDEPFLLGTQEVFMDTSIGIALSSSGYMSFEAILRDADTAMYRAKALGRGRYEIFDQEMHVRAHERLHRETALRHALERREFFLVYLPFVSLETREVIGFEALLRWAHPTQGTLPPEEFLPIAEETGLILAIGAWVMRTAAEWLAENRRAPGWPRELTVSVNLSPREFRHPELVGRVCSVLTESGIEPACLRLDIPEGALAAEPKKAAEALTALRNLGVRLDVHDFGTGLSSLSHLSRLPLHRLKIDRLFVAQMGQSADDEEIVRAVIALGHSLRLEVTAEGIETAEQSRMLQDFGCLQGQGFFFGSPMSGDEARRRVLGRTGDEERENG